METQIRVMNRPADFKSTGVDPKSIALWEDGLRNTPGKGHMEWWYFDCDTDDGMKIGINFSLNSPYGARKPGYHPFVYYNIQLADGTVKTDFFYSSAEETSLGKEQCDVRLGKNTFRGNLKDYTLHVEHDDKLRLDIKLHNLVSPWRPGTGCMETKDNHQFAWFCVVPRGEVDGEMVIDGKTYPVHGKGYHDHQWTSQVNFKFWNQWIWGRQQDDEHTLLLFDLVSTKKLGYTRIPLFFVQDKDGNVLFENTDTDTCTCEVLKDYVHPDCGKRLPIAMRYTFRKGDTEAVYTLTGDKEIVYIDHNKRVPKLVKPIFKLSGFSLHYIRYVATGELVLRRNGEVVTQFKGELLYELESFYKQFSL